MKPNYWKRNSKTAGKTEKICVKQLIDVITRKIPSARGPLRYSPLARVFLLVRFLLTSQVARATGNPNPGVIPPHARAYGLKLC